MKNEKIFEMKKLPCNIQVTYATRSSFRRLLIPIHRLYKSTCIVVYHEYIVSKKNFASYRRRKRICKFSLIKALMEIQRMKRVTGIGTKAKKESSTHSQTTCERHMRSCAKPRSGSSKHALLLSPGKLKPKLD